MTSGTRATRWLTSLWFVAWAAWSSAWCLSASTHLGATFDEPTYVAAGLDRWRGGGIGGLMRLGTMPLPVDAVSLPVWIAERLRGHPARIATDGRGHVVWSEDLDAVLPVARTVTLAFWWVLLWMGGRIGGQLAGPWGSRAAIAFLAVEPSLLAHATLATTDVAATACLLAFAASIASPGRSPTMVPGVWFGLALLSKASALVFAPLIAIAVWASQPGTRDWRSFLRRGAAIGAIGLGLTVVYCGSDWRTDQSFVKWASTLPPGNVATLVTRVSEHLPIFSNAGEGLVQQVKHEIRGHGTYLLGRAYDRSVWFYFPVLLVIKTTAALLLALAALALTRRRALANWALSAAGLMIVCSLAFRVQTGIRMILPLLTLLIIGTAVALVRVTGELQSRARQRLMSVAVAGLLGWSLTASWRAWPDGLRFANELWGGSEHAYRWVSDSNYDWGQGLPDLRRWIASQRRDPIDVWYWGTDPAILSGPWRAVDLRAVPLSAGDTAADIAHGRTLAVSATLLYGSVGAEEIPVSRDEQPLQRAAAALRRRLRARRWIARTGTFFIYDFPPDEPATIATPHR